MFENLKAIELSELLDLSERRINQLASEDILTKNEKGNFSKDNIKEYYKFRFDTKDTESFEKERAKHEEVKRKLSEIKLRREEGKVIDFDEVEFAMTSVISNTKSKLLGLSSKIAPRIISEKNINIIREEIDAEIKDALVELANYKFEDVEEYDENDEERN